MENDIKVIKNLKTLSAAVIYEGRRGRKIYVKKLPKYYAISYIPLRGYHKIEPTTKQDVLRQIKEKCK